jgi:uncharacterized protein Yka (UPF0111/DUF47 family)
MKMLFSDLLPGRALFFDQFNNAAKNVVEMAWLLQSVLNTNSACEREIIIKQIDKKENTGDDITHKIYLCLNKIVFTPLNRHGIHLLASTIDDVADAIKEASGRIYLYNIDEFGPSKEIAAIILQASLEIWKAVNLLSVSKHPKNVLEICGQVKDYGRQADKIYYRAVAELFLNEKDPIRLIKYREILLSLETSVNKCKNTIDALEVIMINR